MYIWAARMIAYAGPQLRAVLRAALVCSKYIVCAVCICFMYYNKGGYQDPPGWYLCVAVGERLCGQRPEAEVGLLSVLRATVRVSPTHVRFVY